VALRDSAVKPRPRELRIKVDRLPLAHKAVLKPSCSWWVGMELNHHSRCGAFTAPWARQCPAYPSAAGSDHRCLKVEEGEGVEPSTRRSARLSRPVAHHCAPPSVFWSGRLDSNQRPPASKAGALAGLSYTLLFEKLALRREIESLSPDRQSGRLTRCVTELDRCFAKARSYWCVWADSNGH
jgi:hypothetical protein